MDPQKNVNPTASDENNDVYSQASPNQAPASVTSDSTSPAFAAPNTTGDQADLTYANNDSTIGTSAVDSNVGVNVNNTTNPADIALGDEPASSVDSNTSAPTANSYAVSTPEVLTTSHNTASNVNSGLGPVPEAAPAPLPGHTVAPGSDPASTVPTTLPIVTPRSDKKTILVLACVAVVLIAAIAALYFM